MNIANVTSRFITFGDIEAGEAFRFSDLIGDACAFVESHCRVEAPDESQQRRLEALAAAYALRLYDIYGESNLRSFTAGDVKFTSSADSVGKGERLWQELKAANSDLIDAGNFLFGRV